jgi:hypothetical protein
MKLLHILRTEPDETVERLIETLSGEEGVTVEALYQENVDWSRLVDDIFAYDKIICWW